LNAEGLPGRVQNAVNIHDGAGIPALIAESTGVLQRGQVFLQVFAGAATPAADRRFRAGEGAHQMEHAFQISVDDAVLDAVGFQAGGKSGNARRRFGGFHDGRMNENDLCSCHRRMFSIE